VVHDELKYRIFFQKSLLLNHELFIDVHTISLRKIYLLPFWASVLLEEKLWKVRGVEKIKKIYALLEKEMKDSKK
jgi:hypothetical protein